jgi:hypothetical protein
MCCTSSVVPKPSPSRSRNQISQRPLEQSLFCWQVAPVGNVAETHAPFWQLPRATEVQAVPFARLLGTHWPCALQVSCPEHSVGPEPQDTPALTLKAVELRLGSQTWQALLGFVAPIAKQVLPI